MPDDISASDYKNEPEYFCNIQIAEILFFFQDYQVPEFFENQYCQYILLRRSEDMLD
jgi:hypothetical protein